MRQVSMPVACFGIVKAENVYWNFDAYLRLKFKPASPIKPVPRRTSEVGSGTAVAFVTISWLEKLALAPPDIVSVVAVVSE